MEGWGVGVNLLLWVLGLGSQGRNSCPAHKIPECRHIPEPNSDSHHQQRHLPAVPYVSWVSLHMPPCNAPTCIRVGS